MKSIQTHELRAKQSSLHDLKQKSIEHLGSDFDSLWNKFNGFPYEQSLLKTLYNGTPKFDRTGTDTIGIHGHQSRFNLDEGFPLVTTKKVFLKGVIYELLWLLRGDTNIKYLVENGVFIWSDWPLKYYNQSTEQNISLDEFHQKIMHEPGFAEQWGELGPVYGEQWRDWKASIESLPSHVKGIDQIQQVIDAIKKQHETGVISRRMLVSAWNVADLPAMIKSGLPPCHCLFQFHSRLMTLDERKAYWAKLNNKDLSFVEKMDDDMLDEVGAPVYQLDLQLYQRSCDSFLGVPFNISSYALLLLMTAQVTNCKPGDFIHDYGDFHIYSNHLEKVAEQLSRDPRPYPTMKLNPHVQEIDKFTFEDFTLEHYNPHPAIKAGVAV